MDRGLKILVVEDDDLLRAQMVELLGVYNHVHEAADCASARKRLEQQTYNVVLLDKKLPDGDGVDLIAPIKKDSPATVVLIITGDNDMNAVSQCINAGAADYIRKTENVVSELLIRIPLAISRASLEVRSIQLDQLLRDTFKYEILGRSEFAKNIRQLTTELKGVQSPILITGDSGTGKELVARRLHHGESNTKRPFIAVNAGALPETLIESELFGHRRGAFTSATEDRPGKFELAHEGDLFLDEIGELPLALQTKLLRVIQEGEFTRLGDTRVRQVRVRIIAATNRNLEEAVRKKEFREDLYYRLNVHRIQTEPLHAHKEDITDIVPMMVMGMGGAKWSITSNAIEKLQSYDWPGNVRELKNYVERAMFQARKRGVSIIDSQDIQLVSGAAGRSIKLAVTKQQLPDTAFDISRESYENFMIQSERAYLARALALCEQDVNESCMRLGMARSTLFFKMGKLGLLKKHQPNFKGSTQTASTFKAERGNT